MARQSRCREILRLFLRLWTDLPRRPDDWRRVASRWSGGILEGGITRSATPQHYAPAQPLVQQIDRAKLVLVIENLFPRSLSRIETYLRTDRNVLLVWDGNDRLYCSDEVRHELSFLV